MRTVVVIPTYWGRKKESMKILKKKDFKLVILICPTHKEIEHQAEEKVRKIVKGVKLEVETYLFTRKALKKIKKFGRNSELKENVLSLLSLEGYAKICVYSLPIYLILILQF